MKLQKTVLAMGLAGLMLSGMGLARADDHGRHLGWHKHHINSGRSFVRGYYPHLTAAEIQVRLHDQLTIVNRLQARVDADRDAGLTGTARYEYDLRALRAAQANYQHLLSAANRYY